MRVCSRCKQEKNPAEFLAGDRGNYWCGQCCLDFLRAHGGDPMYRDAREFVPESLRDRPWTAAQAVKALRAELARADSPGGSEVEQFGSDVDGDARLVGAALAAAVRVPGARALECSDCRERFGGVVGFRKHKPRGGECRVAPGLTKDSAGVWRKPWVGLGALAS